MRDDCYLELDVHFLLVAGLALELDDSELLLLLNTGMTKDIRLQLEELENGKKNETYMSARTAKKRIAVILKEHHMIRKVVVAQRYLALVQAERQLMALA